MKARSLRFGCFVVFATGALALGACGGEGSHGGSRGGMGSQGAGAPMGGEPGTGGTLGTSGTGGKEPDGGGQAGTGSSGTGGVGTGGVGVAGTGGGGLGGSSHPTPDGGSGGGGRAQAGSAGGAGLSAAGGRGGASATGCNLPATVSFQKDVQPSLIKSCGSTSGDGCHIIDGASTTASGGYDHAYDWITAGAHASSCPEKPTPYRYQVVMSVILGANPADCSKSRQMPPPGANARAPLTACQVATLRAWLNEPLVTQSHRADDSSPKTPYPMPPFN